MRLPTKSLRSDDAPTTSTDLISSPSDEPHRGRIWAYRAFLSAWSAAVVLALICIDELARVGTVTLLIIGFMLHQAFVFVWPALLGGFILMCFSTTVRDIVRE
jgi:hypothetical protein